MFPKFKKCSMNNASEYFKTFSVFRLHQRCPPPPFRFFALQVGLLDNIQDTMWSNPAALGGY